MYVEDEDPGLADLLKEKDRVYILFTSFYSNYDLTKNVWWWWCRIGSAIGSDLHDPDPGTWSTWLGGGENICTDGRTDILYRGDCSAIARKMLSKEKFKLQSRLKT